jgi:hypothetical protein
VEPLNSGLVCVSGYSGTSVCGLVCMEPLYVDWCAWNLCMWTGVHGTSVCGLVCVEPLYVDWCAWNLCMWTGV